MVTQPPPLNDEIALVATGASDGSSEQVVVRKPAPAPTKRQQFVRKYKKTPVSFIQVVCLGIFLLALILACVGIETWRTFARRAQQSPISGLTTHDRDDEAYHKKIVRAVNANPSSTWKASYNKFASRADESQVDVVEVTRLLVQKYTLDTTSLMHDTKEHLKTLMNQDITLPAQFDSRERWAKCWSIHQVHNQAGCGSCWSVSATAVMSDRVCIASDGRLQPQISAQDLTSCCETCGGCQGTHWALSSFTWWKENGLVSGGAYGSHEGCKPYEMEPNCGWPCASESYEKDRTPECRRRCQPLYPKNYTDDVIKSSRAYWIRAEKGSSEATPIVHATIDKIVKGRYEEALKRELFTHGPVLACFTVFEDFQHYVSGIYHSRSVADPKELYGHCAKLIGWGVEGGQRYWTYMNTWGRDWGEAGFFRISMSDLPEEAVSGLL